MTTPDIVAKRAAIHDYARRRDELAVDAHTLLVDGWNGWAEEMSLYTHIVDRAMRAEIDDPLPVGLPRRAHASAFDYRVERP